MLLFNTNYIINGILHTYRRTYIKTKTYQFQLKFLSFDELKGKMANLDQDMEREIDDLRRRYHAKRQPILDAMDQKRKRQQNF